MDDTAPSRLARLMKNRKIFWGAIGLYVLCVAGLIGGHIGVSTMDIAVSAYIQAPEALAIGETNAARGLVMNAPTGRSYVGAMVEVEVEAAQGRSVSLGKAKSEPHGHVHLALTPPADLKPGTYPGLVSARHGAIDDFSVEVPITLVAPDPGSRWPAPTPRQTDERRRAARPADDAGDWEGDLRVDPLPLDGELVRGLPNSFYLRLSDAETGAPVQGTIQIDKVEGYFEGDAPVSLRTDRLGLARVEFTPMTAQRWSITAEAPAAPGGDSTADPTPSDDGTRIRKGTGKLRFRTASAQIALRMESPVAVPGEGVNGAVYSLYRSGGFFVDLYAPGRWAWAGAYGFRPGASGLRVEVPAEASADVMRVQVYESFFDPGGAWDVRYVARASGRDAASCAEALGRVGELVARHGEGRLSTWAEAAKELSVTGVGLDSSTCLRWLDATLLALPRHFDAPPLMLNTQTGDRAELEAWKEEVQQRLIWMTALVLFVGLAIVVLLVLQGMRRAQAQRRMIQELEIELAGDEELELRGLDLEAVLVVVRTIIVLFAIATFGAGVLLLLTFL